MIRPRLKRPLALLLSAALVFPSAALPATVAMAQDVKLQNHTVSSSEKRVSGIQIDGIEKPTAGKALDGKAAVSTKEGERWEVPVLWVDDDLQTATKAVKGHSYLPVIAFYVPQGLSIEDDAYQVSLSDSATRLFGGKEIVSVYDASTGITYILPASLKGLFAAERQRQTPEDQGQAAERQEQAPENLGHTLGQKERAPENQEQTPERREQASERQGQTPERQGQIAQDAVDNGRVAGARTAREDTALPAVEKSIVDVYCAQTARDAFTDEDLEWLLDLIVNRIQPQAVNLLIDSFPSFRAAADRGELGREIGLYVYFQKGDDDGDPVHKAFADLGASAAVAVGWGIRSDQLVFKYVYGVELEYLAKTDWNGQPVRDERTGKLTLARDDRVVHQLENVILHETLHALMFDYNRTGMIGATDLIDWIDPSKAVRGRALRLPVWFIEGSATSVQNVRQYRKECFDLFRRDSSGNWIFDYTPEGILHNYLSCQYYGTTFYADLTLSSGWLPDGTRVSNELSAYVCGYLATVYLSELAARKDGGSAIAQAADGSMSVSNERLRAGLDAILRRMHFGETLDEIIRDISPVDNQGKRIYDSTDDFEAKFIKGTGVPMDNGQLDYSGDENSLEFVTTYVSYLERVGRGWPRTNYANGSILLEADADTESPLDSARTASSDFLKIEGENGLVESTVPDSLALQGAGKSDPDAEAADATAAQVKQAEPAATGEEQAATGEEQTAADEEQAATPEEQAAIPEGEAADGQEATAQEETGSQEEAGAAQESAPADESSEQLDAAA